MDWQFDGFVEAKQEERPTTAALRAAAAGIPAESIDTATTSSLDDDRSLPHDSTSRRDRDPLIMTMSPSATAQFRDPLSTFNQRKGVPWPGATAQTRVAADEQDDMLVDLYYKTPSLWMTAAAAAVGFAVGAVLNKHPVSEDTQLWIGVVGSLLIRALECLTLPLMFTSVTICFSNLVVSDKTRPVMVRLAVYFVVAALLASCVAVGVAFCFSGAFAVKADVPQATTNFQFILRCPNGKFFSREDECAASAVRDGQVLTAANVTGLPDALQLSLAAASGVFPDTQSLATQIVLFFDDFFTDNITAAFVNVQFLGVIIFSMIIGAAIMTVYDPASGELNHALVLIRQVHVVLEMILNWLVPYIPLGTLSMMTYSVMTGVIAPEALRSSMYFTIAMVVALLANFFLVACVLYVVLVRRNPLKFTWFLMPGLIYMLATGNYLATIPVLLRSLEKSRQISRTLAQFTICLGVCLCLCGTAVFFVVALVFMAYTSGLEDSLTPGRVVGLIAVATASSIGTPLVPGSALTFTCTIWRTLFASQVPGSFVHVVAMEWAMYRLRRTYNIIVAAFIARIIAEQLDETVEDEEDRAYLDQQLGMTRGPQ
jgi:Na+/H+-dicarboxylate symporter